MLLAVYQCDITDKAALSTTMKQLCQEVRACCVLGRHLAILQPG